MHIQLLTAGLVVVKNQKLLLAFSNNKQAWYLPGGKVDAGETVLEALLREIKEEMSVILIPDRLSYLCHVTAPAYGENVQVIMEQECFLYSLHEDIVAGNEIGGLRYFDLSTYQLEPAQVSGVLTVFDILLQRGLLCP